MRYILIFWKGDPPKDRPPGMNHIAGMREYKGGPRVALSRLRPEPDRSRGYLKQGYTHYGLYESPPNTMNREDKLVASEEIKA